jgi:uncharacterized protein YkwD
MILSLSIWYFIILFVIALALVIVYSCSKDEIKYEFSVALLSPDEKEFLSLLNAYRSTIGIEPLIADRKAGFIAYKHCYKMVNEQRVFHNTEDGRYDDLEGASNFCEIVDGEFSTVLTCWRGFLNSDDHFKIINGKNYNTIGLSIERDKDDKVYCTVIFFRI